MKYSKAIIYGKDNCIYCSKAKVLLIAKNINYDEYILDVHGRDDRELASFQSWATLDELLEKVPGAKTVPQIWLDGQHIGGYTELRDLIDLPTPDDCNI